MRDLHLGGPPRLYNFMDGIDGLAGGEAAVAASFFFLLFAHYGESGWAAANLFIAASSMGFLVYNWPTATLIRRIWRGEKWYTAHRSHYYQRMTNLGWSHTRVTGMELVSAALSCIAAILYLCSGAQVRVLVVSAVLVGFLVIGIWVSKKDPISAKKKNNTGQG
jgi:UDP-N-acetylmuramyl pentapeptide phosphotransferase/UDP-N-acetylglucosamine-1-phosphate transferase